MFSSLALFYAQYKYYIRDKAARFDNFEVHIDDKAIYDLCSYFDDFCTLKANLSLVFDLQLL